MKKKWLRPVFIVLSTFMLAGRGPAVHADHPEGATPQDLRELRTEVNRLDDNLQMLDDGDSRTRGFRDREQAIRDRLIVLRDDMHRHQQNPAEGLGASQAQVADLRRDIRSLSRDIDAAYDRRDSRRYASGDVPDGTEFTVRLEEPLSSRTSRVEERVVATLAEPITRDGRTAIPAGTEISGTVSSVQRAQRPSKGGRLEVNFDQMTVDGRRVAMDGRVVRIEDGGGIDKKKAGLGAIIGGVLGAVLDGKKGALIGAMVGGGGAVVASSGEEVELPAGTLLTVQLERPMTIARR